MPNKKLDIVSPGFKIKKEHKLVQLKNGSVVIPARLVAKLEKIEKKEGKKLK